MRTACLQIVCASVATTKYHSHEGPQMNKFEKVSGDGHQMSLAGGQGQKGRPWRAHVSCLEDGCRAGAGEGLAVQWGPMYHG